MESWTRPAALRWGLTFLGIFLAIHWQEVTSPTMNVDDWALIGDPILQATQSRPVWDLIYPLLFQSSYSPFFGWLLAGISLYATAAVVAVFSPFVTPAWACLLALLISLHAYVLDLFNFGFAIGVYLLPAPLSLWGGVLMAYSPWPPLLGSRRGDWALGVLMLVVAMGIYQPTGYLAAGLLGMQALSSALGQRSFPGSAARRLGIGVLAGGGLYYLWTLLSMHGQAANARTGFASPARFLHKLTDLGVYQEIYSTSVPLLPPEPQVLLSLTFLVSLLLASFLLVRRSAGEQGPVRRLGLLWLAALMLTLLPLLLFYLLDAGFPSRAFCLGNLGIASFLVIVLATLRRTRARWLCSALLGLLLICYVVPQAAFMSKVWDGIQLLERRDMALAQAILADVRSEARRLGVREEPLRLFGTTERTQPFRHWSSVGESAFRQSWSIQGIFRNLLGVKAEHIPYRSEGNEQEVRRSLPRCTAYPEPGSILPFNGGWLVCLEANPAVSP
jgi:hypothetical protein